jgi:hypothetical protein
VSSFSDPRDAIGQLSDELPLLLFPLRLETRFKRVKDQHELWVRVFPDSCLVDSFEPEPSQVELSNTRRYWQALWRSRDGGGERAAWRNLVASHGAGRARWLREAHAPRNPEERPPPQPVSSVVFAVPVEQDWSEDERKQLPLLWEGAWREGADGAAEQRALKALTELTGDEERARLLWSVSRPLGFDDPPPEGVAPADATVVATAVVFPAAEGARERSWSSPPTVELLPERLLCVVESGGGRVERLGEPIPTPLQVGPDPSAEEQDADLRPTDRGGLEVADTLAWTVDFERAVKDGMGFRVPLTMDQWEAGADRVTVVGVRLGEDEQKTRARVERLLAHHRDGRGGLALVPQGTPTNNTEREGTGFTKAEEADAAFDELAAAGDLGRLGDPAPPPTERPDGRWLADALGLDPQLLNPVSGAFGSDQAEARAMNVALWPATLGYFLDTLMAPVSDERTAEQVRWFFVRHVSGRGPLPAIRIGQQPYGIVPATAFARISRRLRDPGRFGDGDGFPGDKEERARFQLRLLRILQLADDDWTAMSQQVTSLGTPGADVESALLEVLGLHPASAEFHYRYAESLDHVFNLAGLFGLFEALIQALVGAALDRPAQDLLTRLTGDKRRPAILDKYFLGRQGRLLGDLVDDRPPSEAERVRPWTDAGANYLEWLVGAAEDSLETLRRQEGFLDGRPPTVLLYLLLRHALLLGYADAGIRLHRRAQVPPAQLLALRREPPFVHVADFGDSESRWAPLFKRDANVTGDPDLTVAEAVRKLLFGGGAEGDHLTEQIEAVKRLSGLPTARLERLLAEHVDTCTYRFDAWRTGWLAERLERLRERRPDGVHVGAYGWLLDVRPSPNPRTPVEPLGGELEELFQAPGDPVLERDPGNGGYIHAPSPDHAVTAAVLRAGYLSNAQDGNPEPLAVNLSSERVRVALSVLEGIGNGQRLGALLGYRIERGLHDGHPGLELDRFVLPLRTAFPLVAERIRSTRAEAGTEAELVAARNVVDGLRIVEQVESDPALASYPFGRGDVLPTDATAAERGAIEAEVQRLRNVNDAVADLLLAESVHQAAQARYDRSAAALDAAATGGWPPEPEVVRTPRPGIALTHRLALHVDPDAVAARGATPRAAAEPRLDRWLETVLPPLDDVEVVATWNDPRSDEPSDPDPVAGQTTVTLADLGLRPVDLLAVVHADGGQQMAELDDRVVARVLATEAVPLDARVTLRYLTFGDRPLRVFDLAAPVRRLRSLVGRARPLRPGDWTVSAEATRSGDADVARDPTPVGEALRGLRALATQLARQVTALDTLARGAPEGRASAVDRAIVQAAALFGEAARYGIPQTGWGFLYEQRRAIADGLLRRLAERLATWELRLRDFDGLLAQHDALDPASTAPDTRLILLRRAEISVAAGVTDLDDLDALRALLPERRRAFDARRRALAALTGRPPATLAALLSAVDGQLPFSDVDLEPFDRRPEHDALAALFGDLLAAATVVRDDAQRRAAAAGAAFDAHAAATTATARVDALTAAAQAIFGEEFVLLPDAGVAPEQAAETVAALAAASSGDLTRHLTDALGVEFPLDEWLTGVARVREQARAWEQVVVAAGAFGLAEPELVPLQFPVLAGDPWLALTFPPETRLDRDRLLYTASLPSGFDPGARRCGLLLDEWTEVIPAERHETAIATHFDRPNSEPPQALLLVLPTEQLGKWVWEDVVGALDDTLAMARKRAVEPVHVDRTPYARLLPATVSATTLRGLSIGLALTLNNPGVVELAREEAGDG